MLHRALRLVAVPLLAVFIASPVLAQEEKIPKEAQKAADVVKAYLQSLKGDYALLLYKDDAALAKTFPDYQFIVARYRQFPVARALPEGLSSSNIFALTKEDQKILHIKDAKE